MKQILKNYNLSQRSETKVALDRIKPNKEMFDICEDDIKILFNFFNELNTIFDTQNKLNWYIQNQYPEYFKKRKYVKNESSSSSDKQSSKHYITTRVKPKKKKRRYLYVDTSNLE
jgi:hypothetical protein